MTTTTLPAQRPAPDGYSIHQLLTSVQWAAAAEVDIAENARTGEQPDDASFTTSPWRACEAVPSCPSDGVEPRRTSRPGIVLCGEDVSSAGLVSLRYRACRRRVDFER